MGGGRARRGFWGGLLQKGWLVGGLGGAIWGVGLGGRGGTSSTYLPLPSP